MSVTDELLANNEKYAAAFDKGDLPLPPAKKVAVVACMDARLNPYGALGLQEGDAHVIRNAGGVITDDEIRSLAISQHLLGTEEIMLIHHTDCGMLTFSDQEFADKLEAETGQATGWHGVGSLRLASSAVRWQELKRSATMAKGFGFRVDLVSAKEARDRFPAAVRVLLVDGEIGSGHVDHLLGLGIGHCDREFATARCKVASWGTSGANEVININCFDPAGTPVNTPWVVDFVD